MRVEIHANVPRCAENMFWKRTMHSQARTSRLSQVPCKPFFALMNYLKGALLFSEEIYPYSEWVVDLNTDNFDEIISQNNHVLIEFYAPWYHHVILTLCLSLNYYIFYPWWSLLSHLVRCGHCKALAPEFDNAAIEMKTDGKFVCSSFVFNIRFSVQIDTVLLLLVIMCRAK